MTKAKQNQEPEKMLTEVELELMNILWKIEEGSVNDVIAQLPKERALAYTSVSTILRILEQKEVLKTRKEGRGHVYIPALKKAQYESKAVKHVVDKVFAGTPVAMVKSLLGNSKINEAELHELKQLIRELEKKS